MHLWRQTACSERQMARMRREPRLDAFCVLYLTSVLQNPYLYIAPIPKPHAQQAMCDFVYANW